MKPIKLPPHGRNGVWFIDVKRGKARVHTLVGDPGYVIWWPAHRINQVPHRRWADESFGYGLLPPDLHHWTCDDLLSVKAILEGIRARTLPEK